MEEWKTGGQEGFYKSSVGREAGVLLTLGCHYTNLGL
jgi:hypothetical protein